MVELLNFTSVSWNLQSPAVILKEILGTNRSHRTSCSWEHHQAEQTRIKTILLHFHTNVSKEAHHETPITPAGYRRFLFLAFPPPSTQSPLHFFLSFSLMQRELPIVLTTATVHRWNFSRIWWVRGKFKVLEVKWRRGCKVEKLTICHSLSATMSFC